MATNKKLKETLLKKLGVTPQRLYQRVKKVKQDFGPMTTEEAIYFIAHLEKIDLTKYLSLEMVDRIRNLVPSDLSNVIQRKKSSKSKSNKKTEIKININGILPNVNAFLSSTMAKDAKEMTKLYPIYYIFENSLRTVIKSILEKKYGKNWWETKVPNLVKKEVNKRKTKEGKQPWHGKRGQHEIFYSNFGDLRSIIEKNWEDFKDFFPSRSWITQKLDELEHPRNVIAHNNPVSSNDKKRIELYFHDWIKLLESKKNLIS